jgi:hypothetical protein
MGHLSAHPSPTSAVLLDFQRNSVATELVLPIKELEISFRHPLTAEPAKILQRYQVKLGSYVLAHIHPVTPDGRPWTVTVGEMNVRLNEQPIDLIIHLTMTPPPGGLLRKFTLHYDVIAHEVMSHRAYVFIRNDWNSARFAGQQPEAIGMIHFQEKSVEVDRTKGSWLEGFRSVLKLGMQHIAEGTDHLLFLLVLLLPAPLLVAGTHWGGYAGLRTSLLKLLKIVSAFTLGHSVTLAIGGLGWIKPPSQLIEILIAISILVSALHAMRPLFPGREPWIAAGFGLVHGLAFASSISPFGFSPWYMALSILGFNLGIEAMQLIVVLVTIPWLVLLSRTAFYPPVRWTGAVFGAAAALTWIAQRTFSWPNPLEDTIDLLAHHSLWIVAALALLAAIATVLKRCGKTSGLSEAAS